MSVCFYLRRVMPKFKVKKEYINGATGKLNRVGDIVEIKPEKVEKMQRTGLIGKPLRKKKEK